MPSRVLVHLSFDINTISPRSLELPKKTKNRISVDVHAPPKIRITGTLRNIKEFYEVFGIEPNMEIIEIFG